MPSKLRSVTIKLKLNMWEQIEVISQKKGETVSDTIRYLIDRGLDERVYKENTELIAKIVKEQVEQVMKPYLENLLYEEQNYQKFIKPVDPRKLALCRRRIG